MLVDHFYISGCSHVKMEAPPPVLESGCRYLKPKVCQFYYIFFVTTSHSSDSTFSCFLFFPTLSGFQKDFYFEIVCFFCLMHLFSLKCLKNKVFLFKKKPSLCA